MKIQAEQVQIPAPGGSMPGALYRPEGTGPHPGVLVLMEAFGLTDHVREVAARLAGDGYLALAPDLYYRERERVVPYDRPEHAVNKLMRTIALSAAPDEAAKDDRVAADMSAALTALAADPGTAGPRAGLVGFCMGGRLAFLLACRAPARVGALVSFYGGRIVPIVEEARTLEAPALLLFGAEDESIPYDHVDRIRAELRYRQKLHEIEIYPEAGHGFFCDERPGYAPEAAADAWQRTLAWLAKHLR